MTRWISLACVLIVATGAATFVFQMLPEPVPEPTIELHGRREGPPPRLEIVGTKFHEFGTMAAKVKGSHSWEFKNVGEGPLDVWLQETTCACTVATLKTETGEPQKTITIAPGRSNAIEVSWEAQEMGPVRPGGHAGHQRPGEFHRHPDDPGDDPGPGRSPAVGDGLVPGDLQRGDPSRGGDRRLARPSRAEADPTGDLQARPDRRRGQADDAPRKSRGSGSSRATT